MLEVLVAATSLKGALRVIATAHQISHPARHEKPKDDTCISSLQDPVDWALAYRS
jgi:hypothetical protein